MIFLNRAWAAGAGEGPAAHCVPWRVRPMAPVCAKCLIPTSWNRGHRPVRRPPPHHAAMSPYRGLP
jgi:hypothetical protein